MDKRVLEAMARWPNVPDVFGWLSLTGTGQWRLHPEGTAAQAHAVGESISNAQIIRFINRNYMHNAQGQWYFQNGPQKVYVQLAETPYIFHTEAHDRLTTHTREPVTEVSAWWLDENGKLYAQAVPGPGLISGRDTIAVLEQLCTGNGTRLIDCLEALPQKPAAPELLLNSPFHGANRDAVPLRFCPANQLEEKLHFVRQPALGYA